MSATILRSNSSFLGKGLACRPRRDVRMRAKEPKPQPFNEGFSRVRTLVNRDKSEFMGNDTQENITQKYEVEFGENATPPKASAPPVITANTVNPFGAGPPSAPISTSPFGRSSVPASPFAAPLNQAKKPSIEPAGMNPEMSPDPFGKEIGPSFFESIGVVQIVLFLSFSTIIGIMIATFFVTLGSGAIRISGVDMPLNQIQ